MSPKKPNKLYANMLRKSVENVIDVNRDMRSMSFSRTLKQLNSNGNASGETLEYANIEEHLYNMLLDLKASKPSSPLQWMSQYLAKLSSELG